MSLGWQIAFAAVAALAIYRITNLIVVDKISDPARDALMEALSRRPSRFTAWLTDLVSCVFCVAVWVSLALVVAGYATGVLSWTGWRSGWFWAGLWWMGLAGLEQLVRAVIDAFRGFGNAAEVWTEEREQ